MKRPVTSLIRVAAVIAVAVGIALMLRPHPILVETAPVTRGTLETTVTAEGKTRVKNLFVVSAPVDGELGRIVLKAGDQVSPSTVIAQIRPGASRPLDARNQAEAAAAVVAARAAVAQAEAAEREAVAALAHAQSAFETSTRLANEGAVAPKDAEHSGHEVEIRRQAVQVARSAIEQSRAELTRAEAAAAPWDKSGTGGLTDIRSPSGGQVLRVLRESAGPVTVGTPLVEIGNTNGLEIIADFLTTDAMAVKPGAPASIRDWGGDQPLVARVRQIDPGAFTKVSALGLEEQRVPIVLDLVGAQSPTFGNGFHVNVAIEVWKGTDVLTVPSTALFRVGNEWAVFVARDRRAHLTRVTTGRADDARTVVEQGLAAGDIVVMQPSDTLTDGARIQMLTR